jgi:soluble calcium-activated nucleotidase 1
MNLGGRGMELSELNVFNGQIYTMDDRTGVIFRLLEKSSGELAPIPWVILGDGDGHISKGMKCEWGCVKGGDLYVGSTGMPNYKPDGSGIILNHDTQWVKKISANGSVDHVDWRGNYARMAESLGIVPPGYVKHESGGWSDTLNRWVFLPRRACKEAFTCDEEMGTNVILVCTENFDNIEVRHVGDVVPTHGFSSFKWVPGTNDQLIVALKTVECGNVAETYIMVFDMEGHILLEETKIADQKYEGIEFV